MAFQKNIDTPFGVSANYWSIRTVSIDLFNQQASIMLSLNVSSNSRTAGEQPMPGMDRFYTWACANFPFTKSALATSDLYTLIYQTIKGQDSFFSDADIVQDVGISA